MPIRIPFLALTFVAQGLSDKLSGQSSGLQPASMMVSCYNRKCISISIFFVLDEEYLCI
jgi:hypothetical protein